MGFLFSNFKVIFLLFCIIEVNFANEVLQVDGNIFVKHNGKTVNVFRQNHLKSKTFSFDDSSFHIPFPLSIKQLNDTDLKAKAELYAMKILSRANTLITAEFEDICGDLSDRSKRFVAIPFGIFIIAIGAGVFYGIVMVIKYEVKLEALQKQLINTQNQLNAATIGLNNITKALAEDEYLTKLKFNLNEYVEKYLETCYEFMKILRSEKAVAIDKIPETFLKHFQGVKNEAFFYLRYAGCKGKNVMIEMTVAEGSPSQIFDCFSYTHVGVFKNDLFSRYKLKSMYCYENGKCSHIDSKKCLVYRDTLNCTESAFYKCDCEVNNVETCPVETKLAPPNFVHIEKCANIITIATKTKFYELVTSNEKNITQIVPSSGIFSVVLNEDDKIKIGGITVDGESENPTFIAQIYPDSFTVDPVPQVSQLPTMPVYEDKNVLENYSLEIIFFLSGLILILVVILCYVIIYCFKH